MGLNEDRHLSGERPTIRSDIDFRVIDTVEFAGNLKERLERGKSWMKSYWNFRRAFYSLFLLSKSYLPSKYKEEKTEMELRFYGNGGVPTPQELIHDFDDYIEILKESGLIELGQSEESIR